MENVEVLGGLSMTWKGEFQICYYSMHNFRQVPSLLSQTSYGTATGRENMECTSEGCWNAGRIIPLGV